MSESSGIVDVLWGTTNAPRRGPKPVLSLDTIVATAIALADAQGLSTLSMQAIAAQLGFTKMSLYRHVPGKSELTALMLDTALGAPPALEGTGWRVQLHEWTLAMYERMRRHPWTVTAAGAARSLGPNQLAWLETGLTALADTGLSGAERLDTVATLAIAARGQVQQGEGAEDEMNTLMASVLAEHGARYPAALAAFTDARSDGNLDNALQFGLDRILDGLERLIDPR